VKRGFNRREAAAYIGRSYSWLAKKAMRGVYDPGCPGPRMLRVGDKGVLYLKEDLDRWLEQWASSDATGSTRLSSVSAASQGAQ
jgi:hypothetical protein